MADLLVVGTGLIGTSVGLAVAGTRDVVLQDHDREHLTAAVGRGAGRPWDGTERVVHVVLAVPPSQIASELLKLQTLGLAKTYSHVASVQAMVQAEVETTGCQTSNVCGTHPMAGAELPGPALATASLFWGRPWLLCPGPTTSPAALSAAQDLALACGALIVEQTADEHDRTVALVSHLPQVAASALAAMLRDHAAEVALSGPGLRDTTRIAASDPRLWQDVLLRSAPHLAPLVARLAEELLQVARALAEAAGSSAGGSSAAGSSAGPREVLRELLQHGREGRALVPVKRGGTDSDFISVDISVPDEPGRLAALLAVAAQAGVNVEDVSVDHLPGRPTGVISLVVTRAQQGLLHGCLRDRGWTVLGAATATPTE